MADGRLPRHDSAVADHPLVQGVQHGDPQAEGTPVPSETLAKVSDKSATCCIVSPLRRGVKRLELFLESTNDSFQVESTD